VGEPAKRDPAGGGRSRIFPEPFVEKAWMKGKGKKKQETRRTGKRLYFLGRRDHENKHPLLSTIRRARTGTPELSHGKSWNSLEFWD